MKTHEYSAPLNGRKGQRLRGSELIMQVHENRCIKRAGVAGLRERAEGGWWSESGAISGPLIEFENIGGERCSGKITLYRASQGHSGEANTSQQTHALQFFNTNLKIF